MKSRVFVHFKSCQSRTRVVTVTQEMMVWPTKAIFYKITACLHVILVRMVSVPKKTLDRLRAIVEVAEAGIQRDHQSREHQSPWRGTQSLVQESNRAPYSHRWEQYWARTSPLRVASQRRPARLFRPAA